METNNNNAPVKATKDFAVAADILYRAWTEPDQLKQWWKPMGKQLSEVNNELKEGGNIEYKFESAGGEDLVIRGKYLEVVPKEKLVYTWKWHVQDEALDDSEYKLNVYFRSSDGGSAIEVSQEDNNPHESIKPHQHGWDEALNQLAQYLESNQPDAAEKTSSDSHAEQTTVPVEGRHDPAGV